MFVVKHRFNWNLCTIQCSASDTNIFKSTQIILIDCLEWYWTRKKNLFSKNRTKPSRWNTQVSIAHKLNSISSISEYETKEKIFFRSKSMQLIFTVIFTHSMVQRRMIRDDQCFQRETFLTTKCCQYHWQANMFSTCGYSVWWSEVKWTQK